MDQIKQMSLQFRDEHMPIPIKVDFGWSRMELVPFVTAKTTNSAW